MTNAQFQHLMRYHRAKRNAPTSRLQGRRMAKGKAKGYGAVLVKSRVYSMSVETQYSQRAAKL